MSLSVDCRLSLYADDSALLLSHKDSAVIADRLSVELTKCKHWLVDNKLSFHVGKTECLLFGLKQALRWVAGFRVFCDGAAVERVHNVKYLGIQLDKNLSGSLHSGGLVKTCAARLSLLFLYCNAHCLLFLYCNAHLLDFNCRKTLCLCLC